MANLIPDLPESLKPIKDYLVKAVQMEKIDPVVSHYCRVYACETGLQIRDKSDKSTIEFLMPMLDRLEKEKQSMGPVEDPKMQIELMALKIFTKADNQYYAGKADVNTVKGFRASGTLMEVCKIWGELAPDIAEKYKYAKVKAAEIFKAVQEGRVAMPPAAAPGIPEGEEGEESDGDIPPPPPPDDLPPPPPSDHSPAFPDPPVAPPSSSDPPPPAFPTPPSDYTAPPAPAPAPRPAPRPVVAPVAAAPPGKVGTKDLVAAEKHTKYALSALQFDDVPEAVKNLQQALKLLTGA